MTDTTKQPGIEDIWDALRDIPDPEIPPVSIVELGMIEDVSVESATAKVRFLPTFAGCPALDAIRESIREKVAELGFDDVRVEAAFDPPWTTDRITDEGRRKLEEFGLAPPGRLNGRFVDIEMLRRTACPFCGSRETTLESPFGPTLCRAIHYCNACKQSFEQFKPV
jgi:ring-1,2-phenylacetyl-CoA epoxidase subunit PaaD